MGLEALLFKNCLHNLTTLDVDRVPELIELLEGQNNIFPSREEKQIFFVLKVTKHIRPSL